MLDRVWLANQDVADAALDDTQVAQRPQRVIAAVAGTGRRLE
jgi:hypothetical protein